MGTEPLFILMTPWKGVKRKKRTENAAGRRSYNRYVMRRRNHPTATSVLEEVRRIVREVLGGQKASVYLFGSWARGDATSQSDIDLAIDAHSPLPPGMLALLRERLEESHVPYRVDVVELSGVNPEFRHRILAEGIRWND